MSRTTHRPVPRWLLLLIGAVLASPAAICAEPARPRLFLPAETAPAGAEPRDMTSPRATRRALRAQARDRGESGPAISPSPRDLTTSHDDRPNIVRRFNSLPRPWPRDIEPAPAPPHRTANLLEVQPAPPASPDVPAPRPTAPDAPFPESPDAPRSLARPIRHISLVDPADFQGLRPAELADGHAASPPARMLAGSWFVAAHPPRSLYCFAHNPLYFEEPDLERCGLSHGPCQPLVSAAEFIGRTALLPYSLLATPPCDCVPSLGDCPTCHTFNH